MRSLSMLALAAATTVALSACGTSTKMMKEPLAEAPAELGTASDANLSVRIDGLVVRDGPGSWARHAYWDEYRVSLANHGSAAITIADVAVVDSFGVGAAATSERKALAQQTKRSIQRHREAGIEVAPGAGVRGGVLLAGGTAVAITGGAAYGAGTITATVGGSGGAGVAAAGAGIALGGVVLAGYGINRMVQNDRIADALQERSLALGELDAGERRSGSAFVPVIPAPTELLVLYRDAQGSLREVAVALPASLSDLHVQSRQPPTVAELVP